MRKQFLIILLAAGIAGNCLARQLPGEIQKIVDNYAKDSSAIFGFCDAKRSLRLDSTLQAADISVGVPFQEYLLCFDSLEIAPDGVTIEKVIRPTCLWKLPIRAKGRYIYFVTIDNCGQQARLAGMGEWYADIWQKVRIAWPESGGIEFIFIAAGVQAFLYFPQKGSTENMVYLNPFKRDDKLALITSRRYDLPDDNRKILKCLKEEYKAYHERKRAGTARELKAMDTGIGRNK